MSKYLADFFNLLLFFFRLGKLILSPARFKRILLMQDKKEPFSLCSVPFFHESQPAASLRKSQAVNDYVAPISFATLGHKLDKLQNI